MSTHNHQLVSNAPTFLRVLSVLPESANAEGPVLNTGETGTRKEWWLRLAPVTVADRGEEPDSWP